MRVDDAVARVVGVRPRVGRGARRIRRAGSPCSSCPRTPRQGGAACPSPSAPTRTRRSGSRSTSDGSARPASIAGPSRSSADGATPPACPIELEVLRLHPARREQHARDAVLLRAISPSCTTAATSTRPTTASRTATAWSWSTPTTRRRCPRSGAGSRARTSPRPTATKVPARESATCSRRARSTGRAAVRRPARAPGRAATRG